MQITNHFSDENKNFLLNFCHHQRKLSCTQALSFKEPVHYLCTYCVHREEYLQRYPFDKEWGLLIKLKAVLRERNVLAKASLVALGRVGRRWLKLIGNVIISRKSFAAVLHL